MKAPARRRLDQLLVERGLVESRAKAQALILAGEVFVDGQKAEKPGHAVSVESRIELAGRLPYVSRGGIKLAAALDHFQISAEGKVCLDVGASTGGFTDCLLQRGAARVYAVDVGAGQLDWKLRTDPRVVVRENINARYLRFEDIGEAVDLAVCDVSFISVTLVFPAIVPLLKETGEMVILVKPQFEVGRGQVGKGGIVRDPRLHAEACATVEKAVRAAGFSTALVESPILGAEGNREFFLHARRAAPSG
ncbi:MAG TPA: TlyA family RNA methyltransferase [Bryobacteraceae bacterium]|nr:TlyA family RNA methyltransferase [Bryobacteraceae bacterium]HOQ46153.1 TlyA family RNA methyltransferase [Bryobacteraceae bacterium]HPQ14013.1 TlyA family RNA methyltransferase [Bryobacteraceae bacterium]HPU72706.1 TlyA family RNA methyltransferase [Bryobacteraceae bacterium]